MPGFDKTGPAGQGPATGRRMGRCRTGNASQTEETLTMRGRGNGRRMRLGNNDNAAGQGRGFGRKFQGGN